MTCRSVFAAGGLAVIVLAGCSPNASEQEIEFRVPVTVSEVGTGSVEDRVVATAINAPAENAFRFTYVTVSPLNFSRDLMISSVAVSVPPLVSMSRMRASALASMACFTPRRIT